MFGTIQVPTLKQCMLQKSTFYLKIWPKEGNKKDTQCPHVHLVDLPHTGQEMLFSVATRRSQFISVVQCSHFWVKNYEVFFSEAQITYFWRGWVGVASGQYFPVYRIGNLQVFERPNILAEGSWSFLVFIFKRGFVDPVSFFEGISCQADVCFFFWIIIAGDGCLVNYSFCQTLFF